MTWLNELAHIGMNRRLSKVSREKRGNKVETHQRRSAPGRSGAAGRPTAHGLDIPEDAGSPLPELDTFLRLCVKPLPAYHIHFTLIVIFEPLQKNVRCLDNLCTVCSRSLKAHLSVKKKKSVWKKVISPGFCLSPPRWSPAHFPPL